MGAAVRALVLVMLAACSVPALSLEGKQCPCETAAGYKCDPVTNRCLATNDAGEIIDSLSATACLTFANETELYRYAGMFDWQHEDASWTGAASITQGSSNAQDSYAFKTAQELTNALDFHVISSMRQVNAGSGEPSLGIVLRAQLSLQDKNRYACSWIPKSRELRIEVTQGGNSTTVDSKIVTGTTALPTNFTMEAAVQGTTLSCCIREIATAKITGAMNNAVAMGYPGLQTNRMEASFGSFVVLEPN